MSGGIFPGYPFTLNIKCIIFAFIIMVLYSFKPPKLTLKQNLLVYFILFIVAYVAMAWYDYYFGCSQLPLQRSSVGITHYLKPQMHEEEKQQKHLMTKEEVEKNNYLIYALHVLLIVPFLAYIGFKREKVHELTYPLLLAMVAFTLVYHGMRMIQGSHRK
jgi:magnesium-transporting ATPase (P-type)